MNLQDLNPMQRLAAETLQGPVLILAGAGSGKTRTVTYRIANLLDHGVPAYRILALTFTNKAAREMRERVEGLVGNSAGEMWIGTFHSVCVRILRRDCDKIGYKSNFTIYDTDDQTRVLKDIYKQSGIDDKLYPIKEIHAKISDAKNHMFTPDEWFMNTDKSFRMQKIHDIFVLYEQRLVSANAMDFDDLLLKTLHLFLEHPPVLEYYQQKFEYTHVDEYQDTNVAQYQFVRLISQKTRNLCVVGDDDQSIYGWRGADIRNILDFEKDFADAKSIKLEQNYRSTSTILEAANKVIAHNTGRKEKQLWTNEGEGTKIQLCCAGDERGEAAWICERITRLNAQNVSFAQIAILYRMHAQSRVLEEMLMRAGIPYKVYGGTRFYDRKEIKDVLAYLRVILNPSDVISLKRIINTPKRAIGDATVKILEQSAREQEISLFDVLTNIPETLASRPQKCVKEFARLMHELIFQKDTMSLSEFVSHMMERIGLLKQFENEDSEENKVRIGNLQEFLGATKEFEEKSDEKTLEAFLENVALVTELDNQEDAPKFITLMTLHSAKGLEYDTVFMAGLEQNLFPSMRSIAEPSLLQEERRLCYVGITRARKNLFISYARQRMIFNQVAHNDVSCFLGEIPPSLINDEWNKVNKESFKQTAPQRSPREANRKPAYPISFGAPGTGQRSKPLSIPGVQKGFTSSLATNRSTNAVQSLFAKGDTVLHKKFGEGKVVEVTGEGSDARIAIFFTAYGNKEFSLSIAPIVKIDQ